MDRDKFQKAHNIIGKSKEIRDLVDIVMQVAKSDISVLIHGESGTGKEIFAKAIHAGSSRANQKLVSVNCGAIPEGILESELFGHEKGSFTGASDSRKGYFEIADGGTLFLDEIGEMPLTTQVKLLRVLETSEFMRLGSEKVTRVNVRIIAASNKNLQEEVGKHKFRNDLYFRLKAVTLSIPPLRERREDINLLIDHFMNEYQNKNRIEDLVITDQARELLTGYYWPGNVRELKNVIETAAALSKDGILDLSAFSPLLSTYNESREIKNLPVPLNKAPEDLDREMIYRALIEIKKDLMELKNIAGVNVGNETHQAGINSIDEVIPMSIIEKNAILNALNYTKWNKKKAAKLLDISERTLYRKIKEYDLR
ncbi:MAG: sigma-54-dependent Fis family transcriptional regulator [Melioribacteraceae bacterium]|nr:sigma-54-dependent Fis family transcriptional regulator [Melioribacteraceae bacterium]